ncbi:MAG: hypothetical protein M1820_002947 [Bogoriella megaspora]|nr:MAG: hypothetical protein M1820_002947 [Bogoriella megaspora]
MFCASLRRRNSYVAIIPELTSSSGLDLIESSLETHELELSPTQSDPSQPQRRYKFLLFSPSSTSSDVLPGNISRIERLASATGGQDIAVILLLSLSRTSFTSARELNGQQHANQGSTADDGIHALSTLQSELVKDGDLGSVPVLPLPTLELLPGLVKHHIASTSQPVTAPVNGCNASVLDLLSLCTVNPPLSQQSVFVITDLLPSLKALVRCMTEAEVDAEVVTGGVNRSHVSEQLAMLRDYLGDEEVGRIMEFWREEWVAE